MMCHANIDLGFLRALLRPSRSLRSAALDAPAEANNAVIPRTLAHILGSGPALEAVGDFEKPVVGHAGRGIRHPPHHLATP
jgi:hypothetical protein